MNPGRANKYAINSILGEEELRGKDASLERSRYSAVYKAVDRLEESLLIYPVEVGRARTGFAVNTYDLTTLGLAFALQNLNEKADWVKMAANHKDLLPKIFGNWKVFEDQGGEELARKSLLGSIDLFWEGTTTRRPMEALKR